MYKQGSLFKFKDSEKLFIVDVIGNIFVWIRCVDTDECHLETKALFEELISENEVEVLENGEALIR